MNPNLSRLLDVLGDEAKTIPALARALGLAAADIDAGLLELHRLGLVTFTGDGGVPAWRRCGCVTDGEARR